MIRYDLRHLLSRHERSHAALISKVPTKSPTSPHRAQANRLEQRNSSCESKLYCLSKSFVANSHPGFWGGGGGGSTSTGTDLQVSAVPQKCVITMRHSCANTDLGGNGTKTKHSSPAHHHLKPCQDICTKQLVDRWHGSKLTWNWCPPINIARHLKEVASAWHFIKTLCLIIIIVVIDASFQKKASASALCQVHLYNSCHRINPLHFSS